ncbi:MAG: DNRLRE domain-containing protein [archaeon]|jgi:hypothetical protein|nr:DNRLRE domain-containing protein [archaeon]
MKKLLFVWLAIGLLFAGSVYSAYTGPVKTFEFREDGAFVNMTEDVEINQDYPTNNFGNRTSFTVDRETPVANVLIKFPNIFGEGQKQISLGTKINSAVLSINCFNKGKDISAYLVLEGWAETEATWNERKSGLAWTNAGADGTHSSDRSVKLTFSCTSTEFKEYDITSFAQAWSDGKPNYGIVFESNGTDGLDFYSSEHPNYSKRPLLTVNVGSDPVIDPPVDPVDNPPDVIGSNQINFFELGDIIIIAMIFGLIVGVIVLGRRILAGSSALAIAQENGSGLEQVKIKPIDPKEKLKALLKEKKNVEHMLKLTSAKYHSRELDEGGYQKIVRDYQEKLISIEAEIDSIQGKVQ